MRAVHRAAAALAAVMLLGACSSDGSGDPEPDAGPAATPEPTETPRSWNPCDDLTAEEVTDLLGEEVTEESGTPAAPRCTYLPATEGGATLDLNYLWFDGPFEEAWASIGDVAGTVRELEVPTAEAARMVVQVTDEAVGVTGFVQTGGLIESVNAISLDPADRDRVVRATRGVLRLLSARAPTKP